MPDHVHLLVAGTTEAASFLRFLKKAKQLSGYYYKQRFGQPLWQPNSYEHVLRDEEATGAVLRYILENPVKARLVETPVDYPHVGSDVYTIDQLVEFLQFPERWELPE